jgi:hypothetical protein
MPIRGRLKVYLAPWLLSHRPPPERVRVIFLLPLKAGLRAKEIAAFQWSMLTDAEGKLCDAFHLTNATSKGRSGRVITLNKDLRVALDCRRKIAGSSRFVIITESLAPTSYFCNKIRWQVSSAGILGG